ncbi:MAG: hypothetical protein JXQ93_01815 [Flavobacteriaceae bacterium]
MSLSKKSKILLLLAIGGILIAFGVYSYAYQAHKTIEEFSVEFDGKSNDFLIKIQENDSIWQNKAVVLTGTITSKDTKGIMLDGSIYCQFRDSITLTTIENNQSIKIKGRIIGYDDLLEELKLDQCIIQQ